MRQLMDSNSCARRAGLVEVLTVDLVVTTEVVHRHQVGRDADQILQPGADRGEDVADVLQYGARLLADVERNRPELVDRSTRDRVVGPPAGGPGHERETARHLHMREAASRDRLTRNDFRPWLHAHVSSTQTLVSSV